MQTMLFHRDFRGFTGGHYKVWNYFNHVETAPGWRAGIYFSPESVWNSSNPWLSRRAGVMSAWQPKVADAVFLGGFDWQMIPVAQRDRFSRPVVNLVQHVHHGDPAHALSGFLSHRAVRVCVSEQVRDAIAATGKVSGPAFVIPNGIDFGELPVPLPPEARTLDWLVCGLKEDRSTIARELSALLRAEGGWGQVETLTKPLPRGEFLEKLASARAVVLLPRATEGFYLPALEAMALGTLVICPDCVGNRSFCLDGKNAVVPSGFEIEALLTAMRVVRNAGPATSAWIDRARQTATEHSLGRERAAFHELLAALPALW